MIILKIVALIAAACLGGFSFGSLFNFLVSCVAGFILLGAVEPGWGRVIALLSPLGLFWLFSSLLLPGVFHFWSGLFQMLLMVFVFGVPLDSLPFDVPDRPRKRSRALVVRDEDRILDAEIVDD